MPETKTLHRGDPCPNCGAEFRALQTLSPEEYRRAFDRENPIAVSRHIDTASPAVRAELGDLHRCVQCGYQTRFKADEGEAAAAGGADTSARATKKR